MIIIFLLLNFNRRRLYLKIREINTQIVNKIGSRYEKNQLPIFKNLLKNLFLVKI